MRHYACYYLVVFICSFVAATFVGITLNTLFSVRPTAHYNCVLLVQKDIPEQLVRDIEDACDNSTDFSMGGHGIIVTSKIFTP